MTQEELRKDFVRFLEGDQLKDCQDLLDIFLEFLFLVLREHNTAPTKRLSEAQLVQQMLFAKTKHLKDTLNGISYSSRDGSVLNNIIDPTIVASLIRNIFETVAMFHIVFIKPNSEEKQKIIYNLWAISGLNFRQKFENDIIKPETRKKYEEEKQLIEELTREISETSLFSVLSEKDQNKLLNSIKNKEYKVIIDDNNTVKLLHWHEVIPIMNIKVGFMDNIYTYFSLYAHPSNVAVFQYQEMFRTNEKAYLDLSKFNTKFYFILMSIFISDYIKLFPDVLKTFSSLPINEQIALNAHNRLVRGDDHSINDAWQALN